ncbi:MAG: hypothetical protein EPN89_13170, partial [Methylovulum sp.]
MTKKIAYYSQGATLETYAAAAIGYVASNDAAIKNAANDLGMPEIKTAIAGAMAEENHSYETKSWQKPLDNYALSDVTKDDLVAAGLVFDVNLPEAVLLDVLFANVAGVIALLVQSQFPGVFGTRSHAEWQALYEQVKGTDSKPASLDRIANPVLLDLGPGNIQMRTAIQLITDHRQDAERVGINVDAYTSD